MSGASKIAQELTEERFCKRYLRTISQTSIAENPNPAIKLRKTTVKMKHYPDGDTGQESNHIDIIQCETHYDTANKTFLGMYTGTFKMGPDMMHHILASLQTYMREEIEREVRNEMTTTNGWKTPFTKEEDEAILKAARNKRPGETWARIAHQLASQGFPYRDTRSLTNRRANLITAQQRRETQGITHQNLKQNLELTTQEALDCVILGMNDMSDDEEKTDTKEKQ